MRVVLPLYEGDGYLHYRSRRVVSTTAPDQRPISMHIEVPVIEQRVRESPSAGLSKAFRRLAGWIERKIGDAKQRQVDAYLSQTMDHADLERRLEEIERNSRLKFG